MASVTKLLHLKAYKLAIVQDERSPHSNIWNTIVKFFWKLPVLGNILLVILRR
jgi:hypothetical protein